jgi:hypothetical protein
LIGVWYIFVVECCRILDCFVVFEVQSGIVGKILFRWVIGICNEV